MKEHERNIEDLLRDKADSFETPYTPDWSAFEQKLERAIFFRRMKLGAIVTAVLILLNIGIFGTSSLYDFIRKTRSVYYQPRLEESHIVTYPQAGPAKVATSTFMLQENSVRPPARLLEHENLSAAAVTPAPSPEVPREESRVPASNAVAVASLPDNSEGAQQLGATQVPAQPFAGGNSMALSPLAAAVSEDKPAETLTSGSALLSEGRERNLEGSLTVLGAFELPELRRIPEKYQGRLPGRPYISPLQEENPWSWSFNIYPNWTFRKFLVDQGKERFLHRDFIDAMQVSESGGLSLNVGLKLSRRIGPITYLNTGLEYISYKTEARFDFLNFRTAHINEEGEITSYSLKNETERVVFNDLNVYHYINLPLSISHEPWVNDHIRLNIEGGFSFMYFVAAEGKTLDYTTLDVIDLSSRSYQNKLASAFIKTGATYHISDKFNLGFEPTLMYFTNTIYSDEYPFKVIPYSVGMNLKLQLKLN